MNEIKHEIFNRYFGKGSGRENYVSKAIDYARTIEGNHSRKVSFRCVLFMSECSEKQAHYIIDYVEKNNAIQVLEDFYEGKRYMFNN